MIITAFEVVGNMLTLDAPRFTEHWNLTDLIGYQIVMPPASTPDEPWKFTLAIAKHKLIYHVPADDADEFDIILNSALQVNARPFNRQLEQISEQLVAVGSLLERLAYPEQTSVIE